MKTSNKSGVFAALRMAARAHYPLTIGTLLCVAASVIASLLPPLLLARIIDGLTAGLPLTIWAVLVYFASLALEGVLSSAQESLLVLFGQKMTHALRSEMSHKLTQLPARTLVDQNPGEVAARLRRCGHGGGAVHLRHHQHGGGRLPHPFHYGGHRREESRSGADFTAGTAAVRGVYPPCTAPHAGRSAGQPPGCGRRLRPGARDAAQHPHHWRAGHGAVHGTPLRPVHGAGYAAMERTNFYDAVYSPVVLLLNAVVVGIVMLLSASGNAVVLELFGMSVGTSVAVINYISRIFAPIESLGMEVQTIQSAMAGVKRIDAFLAQPEREISAQRTRAARGDVELSHVTFGYGEKHVLNDFSMTAKQGEQVTLIGRTGAGKSTVFRLLLGLYPAESGTVTIGGVPVADITDRERRTCISCVEQHFARVPGTVLDQITLRRSTDHRRDGQTCGPAGGH